MTVRPMRPEELAAVQAMHAKLLPDEPAYDFGDQTVFVWEERGRLGGLIAIGIRPWADACDFAPCPYIESWFVEADLRKTGVGAALMAAAEDWARNKGFVELGSDALLENAVSIEAHQRLGFDLAERLQLFHKKL
jgi:aminoglycoside 6'-N-acetyltransferase I